MSVRRSDFIFLGFEISEVSSFKSISDYFSFENSNSEFDEDYVYDMGQNLKVGELCYLEDYMSGNYSLLGVPLSFDIDGYNGIDLFKYDLKEDYIDYINLIINHSKEYFNLTISKKDIKLIVLTHWS